LKNVKLNPTYEWDEAKRVANVREHKVDFTLVERFEWELAVITVDDREDYGELREQAWSFIGDRVYLLVFTLRGENIRVISLRKADQNETRYYARTIGKRMARSQTPGIARRTRNDRRRRRGD
jgi:uncharacterized DUF497 family protein